MEIWRIEESSVIPCHDDTSNVRVHHIPSCSYVIYCPLPALPVPDTRKMLAYLQVAELYELSDKEELGILVVSGNDQGLHFFLCFIVS